jgi:hypothetical protein
MRSCLLTKCHFDFRKRKSNVPKATPVDDVGSDAEGQIRFSDSDEDASEKILLDEVLKPKKKPMFNNQVSMCVICPCKWVLCKKEPRIKFNIGFNRKFIKCSNLGTFQLFIDFDMVLGFSR